MKKFEWNANEIYFFFVSQSEIGFQFSEQLKADLCVCVCGAHKNRR